MKRTFHSKITLSLRKIKISPCLVIYKTLTLTSGTFQKSSIIDKICLTFIDSFFLRPLVDGKKTVTVDSKTGITTYSFEKESDYAKRCFINDQSKWPTPDQLNFDMSQYNAVKLALNNKLALIQGYFVRLNL